MRNKTESYSAPERVQIVTSGSTAQIIFAENIEEVMKPVNSVHRKNAVTDETRTVFVYDRYTLTVPYRKGLSEDVLNNTDKWLEKAKQEEYKTLAEEVRTKRNRLLAECDAEFVLDRINLNIPENVTAATMLGAVRDIFAVLGSVCNSEMAKYRQALRDIPEQEGFPYDVRFPVKPKN